MKEESKKLYLDTYFKLNPQLKSKGTIKGKRHLITTFLKYLDGLGISGLNELTRENVYDFMNTFSKCSSMTKSTYLFYLRQFLDTMYDAGFVSFSCSELLPRITSNKRERVASYYTMDEVRILLASTKNWDLKHRCMVMLLVLTGMRESDVLDLRIGDIKWDKGLIERIQVKTGLPLSVPIPEELKMLLIAYIADGYRENEEKLLFLSGTTGKRYSSHTLSNRVSIAIKNSEIDIGQRKHGSHALRHSLASRLLEVNAPMPVISGILGHNNLNTTRLYLSIDIENLRFLSLEVTAYEDN